MLARMAADKNLDFISFECLPMDLVNVFEDDLNGMYLNRLCPDHDVFV